ncbi:MAG: phosphotransferase, partial [Micrococcales bacterium]|nr:phosphotransferase [Micrococcales bacterium]
MLSGDALSQWLQQQHITVVRGSLVRLGPSRLPQVSAGVDSHPIRVLLPVLRGGQAAVARAVVDGTQGPELALRVQAISSQTERARQTQRLVTMLTIAEQTRANPVRYPSVLAVLESFVMVVPGDQLPVGTTAAQHELWCDVMPWCPTSLARARDDVLAPGPSAAVARLAPLVRTVHAVHEHLSIVHRDITPNNVLVDPAGRLLLADWGIAHTVTAGQTSTSTELVGNRGFSLPPE